MRISKVVKAADRIAEPMLMGICRGFASCCVGTPKDYDPGWGIDFGATSQWWLDMLCIMEQSSVPRMAHR